MTARALESGQSLTAAGGRTDQAHLIEKRVAERVPAGPLSRLLGLRSEATDLEEMLEEGQCRVESEVGASLGPQGIHVAADEGRQSQGHLQLSASIGLGTATRHPDLAAREPFGRPQERHHAVSQLGSELDRRGSQRAEIDRHGLGGGLLRQVGRRALAAQPARDAGRVLSQGIERRRHVDPQGAIDRLMADAEAEDHPASCGVGDQGRTLCTRVRLPQVDVSDPGSDLDRVGGLPHQLGGCQHVVVDLGAEDRFEAAPFGLAGHGADLRRSPTDTRNDAKSQTFGHRVPPEEALPITPLR